IMNLVNINYDYKEKLKMPENQKEFKKYGFDLMGTNYESYDVVSIDTTYLTEEYVNKFKSKGLRNVTKDSFDQSSPVLYEKFNQKTGGQFNEYNAEVVLKICNSFLKKHSKEEMKNKIGIICLSNNQKNLIKFIINSNENFSQLKDLKIKIDTIDNFQGREKEIIIVDFVRSLGKLGENSKLINYENKKRNLDFISSTERNNVALSRAKNKLILVGAFNYYIASKSGSNITSLAEKYVAKSKHIKFD
ncbi:MAG: C-terminal helicase domain-containing protein, partial [Malacoplasma sp.]|nr:C-terminal helicase domain-containing protein [Malacoplasma sp.]